MSDRCVIKAGRFKMNWKIKMKDLGIEINNSAWVYQLMFLVHRIILKLHDDRLEYDV